MRSEIYFTIIQKEGEMGGSKYGWSWNTGKRAFTELSFVILFCILLYMFKSLHNKGKIKQSN